jgi:hypothetical protein
MWCNYDSVLEVTKLKLSISNFLRSQIVSDREYFIYIYIYIYIYIFIYETGSCHVAQAGLEFEILLPSLSDCWDYRHGPQYPGTELICSSRVSTESLLWCASHL